MMMTTTSTTSALRPVNMMLTFGASGRVYALLSLRALHALIQLLLRGFLLVLLHIHIPFCRARSITTTSQGRPVLVRVRSGLLPRRPKVDKEAAARREMAIRRLSNTDGGHFSLFTTERGDTIFTRSWTPKGQTKTRGVVVLMHGLNEHSARYHEFANQLNHIGLKVYAMDWIGHGGSDGLHGYVHSLDAAVDDLKSFLAKKVLLADTNTGLPCFLFGHSTGAAIVLKAALDPMIKARIQGVVLTSPAIHVETSHPIVPVVAPIFSLFVPKLQFGAADKKDGPPVSRDPEAVRAKYSDPLVFTGAIRVRTGYEILRISSHLQRNLHRVDVPFLVMHGTADTVSEPKASQRLYDVAASSDKSIKLYQGFVHDLLFEPERHQISQDILDWLSIRIR